MPADKAVAWLLALELALDSLHNFCCLPELPSAFVMSSVRAAKPWPPGHAAQPAQERCHHPFHLQHNHACDWAA